MDVKNVEEGLNYCRDSVIWPKTSFIVWKKYEKNMFTLYITAVAAPPLGHNMTCPQNSNI